MMVRSSNMAGARSGCKAIILQKASMAVYKIVEVTKYSSK